MISGGMWIAWHEFWGTLPVADGPELPPPVSAYALKALELAKSQIGRGEQGRNNEGEWVRMYRTDLRGNVGPAGAWCAAFGSWYLEQAARALGIPCPIRRSHGAKKLFRNCCAVGTRVERPRPGDVALWHRGAQGAATGHFAIVAVTEVTGVKFRCIEGNKGPYPAPIDYFDHVLGEADLLGFCRLP